MESPKVRIPKSRKRRRTTSGRGYYSTPGWRALALACKARDGERCVLCGMGRTTKRRLHAHHIIYRSEGGPDALWNLVTLCSVCHADEHPNMRRRSRTVSSKPRKKR